MFNFNKNGIHVVKYRVLWMCLSAVLLLPGIIAMIYSMITYPTHTPLKVGIDYTGGSILQYETKQNVDNKAVGKIQTQLSDAGITSAYIQVLKNTSKTEKDNMSIISVRTKFIDEAFRTGNKN